MKRVLFALLLFILMAIGALFAINGSSNYDPGKYSLTLKPDNKPFGMGSTIDLILPDQFNEPKSLKDSTKKLIFVFTKPTGHIFKSLMAYQEADFLNKNNIVAVADVSGMPTVILNTFAMPDFRKSAYSILLIYDEQMASKLKEGQAADKVIVMTLDNRKVIKIELASNKMELARLLDGKTPGQ